MMQQTFADVDPEYKAFCDKFKPKKTTDDCYTPDNVYNCIRDWACRRYSLDPQSVIRPFWPGGDYERHEYPEGCIVLDNPPFSILSRIVRFYTERDIRFFLFGPSLSIISGSAGNASYIITGTCIRYANGAEVMTGFVHNLDPEIIMEGSPELADIIDAENKKNLKMGKKDVRKLALPDCCMTSARMQYLARHGQNYRIRREECVFIRKLDNLPSGIFGGGLILSERATAERAAAERAAAERAAAERAAAERSAAERATAERAAAERVQLSPREIIMQQHIGTRSTCPTGPTCPTDN